MIGNEEVVFEFWRGLRYSEFLVGEEERLQLQRSAAGSNTQVYLKQAESWREE